MHMKKIFLGFATLLLTPGVSLAGVEPIYGDFKMLPPQCKSLKSAKYLHSMDFFLIERDRLAKEIGSAIQASNEPSTKQTSCQNYAKAIQTVENNFKNKVSDARLKASGSANMIGQVAVLNGIRNLSPECHSAIKAKEQEIARKEMQIKALCK